MKKMNSNGFRKELVRIMPGYTWTIHRSVDFVSDSSHLSATGIQSSGFNRLSTLKVIRRDRDGQVEYEVKSAGFGKNAPWLAERTNGTLARALRALQDHYETMAMNYSGHASALKFARKQESVDLWRS